MKLTYLILTFFILFSTIIFSTENIYLITIGKPNMQLSLNSIELTIGPGRDYIDQPANGYSATIFSFKNEKLMSYNFSISEELIIESGSDIDMKKYDLSNESILLQFPYYNHAKKIEILDETGKPKLEIDLSSYARCNENEFCDFNENLQTCQEDCRQEVTRQQAEQQETPQEPIEEEILAATETQDETLMQKLENKGISKTMLLMIIILAVTILVILIISRKKEK